MNKIYKHVTNAKNGQLVSAVAAETARNTGGSSTVDATSGHGAATATNWLHAAAGRGLKSLTAGILTMMGVLSYAAAPVGVVAHGQASLVTQGSVLHINQTSQAATVNFQQLNLAKGEGVAVQAQKTSDITLLRVASGMNVNGGFVTANNNLLISSPGGILVSNGGKISAQGEVFMTTQDMAVGQYNKPTAKASTGSLSISGQSVISGSNIVLDAGSVNLSQAKVIAAPATATDGIRVQGANVSIQSSHLSAPGGKIDITTDAQGSGINVQNSTLSAEGGKLVIGVDALGAYAAATTVQGSALSAQSVQLAGRVLNLDSTNSVAAAHTHIQTVDLLVNADIAKLLSAALQAGSDVVLQGDNSVSMDHDATIVANTAHNTSLSIANTGSQQNNPNAPSSPTAPKPNQVAILGTINLNGGRKSLLVHSAGDLTLDGTRTDVSGDTTFQAVGTIVVNAAHLSTVGDLTIGRDAFGQGGLAAITAVSNSTLVANRVETSGDMLGTEDNIVKASEWLLDPTNITITSGASTNASGTTSPAGTLATALARGGNTNIRNTDIQAAINAGTSVNIVGSGTITQSASLTFTNNSGTAATLTFDNTSGSKQRILLSGGITATGTSVVNIIAKSAGGLIQSTKTSTLTTAAINVTGDVTFDNTYAVNGTTSGFITELNAQTYAGTIKPGYNANAAVADGQSGVRNSDSITAKNITLKGANGYASTTLGGFGVWVEGNLRATQNINVTGAQTFTPITSGYISGVYTNSAITINSTTGVVNITGKVRPTGVSGASAYYMGTFFNNGASTRNMTITGNQINIAGYSSNSVVDTNTNYFGIYSLGTSYVINPGANYANGGTAVSLLGSALPNAVGGGYALMLFTDAASPYSTNTGFGSVTNNASGGDIKFTSLDAPMHVAFNTISVAKNNTGIASSITYDSTSATNKGTITNYGVVSVASGGSTAVNFVQKTNGAMIYDNGGSISVSGSVSIDNTNGSTSTATVANSYGILVTAPITAGVLAGSTGVTMNAVSSGTGAGLYDTASITTLAGPVTLTSNSAAQSAIILTGVVNSAAGFTAVGTSTTAATVVAVAAINNTAGNISITGNNAAAGGSVGISSTTITQNQVGGNISLISNNKINQSGAVTLVANTGNAVASILYDTRSGNSASTIQNGALSVGAGTSTSAINFSQLTNGALITNGGVAVPGFILIDNTNGSSSTSTIADVKGATITGALSAGLLAGSNGVKINTVSSGTGVGIESAVAMSTLAGPVSLSSISETANAVNLTATSSISSAGGISIIGTSSLASSFVDTYGAVSVLGTISNAGPGGVLVRSTANTATGEISDSGSGGINITGGHNIAAGTLTGGTITAVGTLTNTGGGVISLSMAQPTATPGTVGSIEAAAGVTSGNATTASNVSYGNVGGVMGAVNAATVNTVNYRNTISGTSITLEVENYSEVYGTSYSGTVANGWLSNSSNVTVSSVTGSSSGFGIASSTPSNADVLSSLRFAGNLGAAGNSNLVQSNTNLSVLGAITSSYGTVNVTSRANKNTYTITPKALTITGRTTAKVYDGVSSYADVSVDGSTYVGLVSSIGGVLTGDAVTSLTRVITTAADTATPISGLAVVGSYVDTLSSAVGSGLSNYTITYVPGAFTVTPAALTVTGSNRTTTYNATLQNNNATYSVTGLLGTDSVSSVTGVASGTNAGTYTDSLSGALGAGLSNYTINYVNGAFTINRAALNIASAATSSVYTAGAQTGTYTVTGLQGSVDAVTAVTGLASGTNAGTYTSTLGGATGTGLGNYDITYTNAAPFTITKANATLVGVLNNTAVYNGAAQTNTGAVFTGLLGDDAITITATGYAQATNVAQGTVADNLSATGADSGNYNFTVTNGSLRITPKALSVVGAQTTSVYNANTQTNTYTTTGLVGSDAIAVTGSASARNVSTINDALSVAFTSGAASNYTTTITDGFLKITPAIISVSGITAADKVYDGNKTASLSLGSVTTGGVLGTDSVTVNTGTLTGAFTDKNVGSQTVVISGISLSGPDAANYQLSGGTTATTTAAITPKTLNVTGTSLTTTYNGGTQSLAAPVVTGLVTGDNVTIGGNASGTNAGTYTATYTAGGTDAGNYNLVSTAPATLTVNKAALVVTADNNAKFVTQADPALSAQVSGFQGADTQANMNFGYSIGRADSANNAVGTYAVTASNATATSLSNYTVSYVPGVFTISPAGTVLIKMNPTTSTYGTVVGGSIASVEYLTSSGGSVLKALTNIAGTNRYTDGIGGEISITPTTSVTATTNAGTYVGAISNTNTGTALSNNNFTGVETIVNTAVVNQANLTLALAPVTKTYDGTAFAATGVVVTPTGLMNGQTLDNLGGLTYSGAAIGAINASNTPYSLVGSVGSGFANYNVTIAPSTVTINKAPLQITGDTNTYTFDNTTRTNTYSVTGGQLFANDSITGLTGRAARLHAGATADTLSAATGIGLSNYNISYVNGGLTINPAQLLAVATPTRTPVYNGSTAVPNTTVLSGVIAGTSVSGVTSLALSGAGVGTQTIINNGTLLSGPNSGDYVVLSSNLAGTGTNQVTPNLVSSGNGGGTVAITPAPLTITGGTTSHVFNNTQRTNTYSVTSGTLYGSDSVSGVTGLGSGLRANTTATPVYADNLSAATGSGLSNYAITYVNGGLTITPAPLTALATPVATTYSGGTSVANTTALNGVIAGTTVAGTTSLVMGSPNAGTQTITNNGTTLSGDFATDYYVVSSNLVGTTPNRVTPTLVSSGNGGGTIVVAQAPLSIVGGVTQAVYNGTQQTNTATVTGAVNGEVITTSGSAVARNVADGTVTDALVAVAGSGVNLNNYQIAITQGTLEITPATLTVSGITANSKPYDGTDAATLSVSTVSYNGVFAVDANDTNKLAVNTASLQGLFADPNAGLNKDVLVSGISITGSASSNYQLSGGSSLIVEGTITPAPLTITGDNASHVFNNTTRTNTYSVSGTLYGSDSVTGVTGSGTGLHARTYADNLSAASGNGIENYDVTYVNGALNITRAQLTALATPLATMYSGGTNVANTTALTGVIAGTDVSGLTSLVLGSPNAGLRNIINNGTTLSGPNGGDYEVVSSNLVGTTPNQVTPTLVSSGNGGGTIMVAKAPLTIAGATTQMMYNGTQQTNTATVTGAVNGETITTSGNAVARNAGDVVTDSLQAVAGSGVDLNNYAITFTPGSLEITPAPFVAAPAAPLIEKPADVFILPPTPPVFVAPLDRISDVLANLSGIRLSPANDPAGQPGACSADSAVLFGADSDVLTDEAKEKLRQCCAQNQPMTLSGLRGSEGAGQFNIDLGKRRAQVVRKFMENACQMPQAGHPGKPQ
jgi:outer membrane protein OmpA-like peptidoglycan-associated protein